MLYYYYYSPHPPLRPDTSVSSRYIYNSDKSELIIPGVSRSDAGKYICNAVNKIGRDNATLTLDVIGEKILDERHVGFFFNEKCQISYNGRGISS